MSFSAKRLPDLPIVLLTLHRDYDLQTEFPHSFAQVTALLDAATEPVFYVNDFTEWAPNIEDIVQGSSKTSREDKGTYHHPNVSEVLFVSPDETMHMAAKGLGSAAFGFVRAKAFSTLDEALEYVRSQVGPAT